MDENNIHKTKITTNLGTFEFEGPKEFVETQTKSVLELLASSSKASPNVPANAPEPPSATAPKQKTATRKTTIEQPKLIPNFISEGEKIKALRQFFSDKKPESHIENFAVITYWLKTEMDLPEVSINELWTVYKILNIKAPKVLVQVFRDGKSKKVYFENGSKPGSYFITSIGETFVDHDLPREVIQKS